MANTTVELEGVAADLVIDQDELDRAAVLQKGIKWEAYPETYLTLEEMKALREYDDPLVDKADMLRRHGKKITRLLMTLLAKFKRPEELRYILTLVLDSLKTIEGSHRYYFELVNIDPIPGVPDLPYGPIFGLLSRKDDDLYIVNTAGSVLTFFLISFPKVRKDMVESAMHWFIKKLGDDPADTTYYRTERKVLENLRIVLRKPKFRLLFARESGLEPLFELSKHEPGQIQAHKVQLIYSALYCIWLLSYHSQVQATMTVPVLFTNLCSLLRTCSGKDKVVRMVLAILKNLLNIEKNNQLMLSCGLDKHITQIKTRPSLMADKDVLDDVEEIEQALDKIREDLSSFEVYFHEVQSRNLRWSSPIHKSDKFWVESSIKIENAHILDMLKEILVEEENPVVLCVACWDVGEFVRFHPNGKRIVQNLELKGAIMKLLGNGNTEVRSQALLALQKIMITNWEYLQS
eukprot:TRINITY_DN4961_c0_g1_i20.p1 TRINITY_DN4961_c0_g1~~TRINITY_DN4961_c0_g1_i20.p1  ORF type:complete len:462 (-),score=81.13 TRINITY_DN4961_c0_g1_i20:122-1507(-)